jgi:sugar phosphate isomerase/epimerase
MNPNPFTRRELLGAAAGAIVATAAEAKPKKLPVGIELYSVRDELSKDLFGTVTRVAKMGYEVVEFFSPYSAWSAEYAKEVRKVLDDQGIKCLSLHTGRPDFEGDRLKHVIELNQIVGSKTMVMSSAGRTETKDDWKAVADLLTATSQILKPLKMRTGYHNHQLEFTSKEGFIPMPFLAANTPKDVTLQFDVGTCMEMGYDPLAWIAQNPGRIRSLHLKDWGKGRDRGYSVLFGEGDTPWKALLDAAAAKGGAEYFLIEQEGSRYSQFETAERCLANYHKLRG